MSDYIAKILWNGEGASISFGDDLSYTELCDNIRTRFPELKDKSLRLKYTILPDATVYQLGNHTDMKMMFRVLKYQKSDWVDINVQTLLEPSASNIQNVVAVTDVDECRTNEANEFLGCFRREDAKAYISRSWKNFIRIKGQVFEGGVKEFRLKLRMYAIEVGFQYRYEINSPGRVSAVCKKKTSEGCNWAVKASLIRHNGFFNIYELCNVHQCKSVIRLCNSKMLSSKIVKEMMVDKVRDNPNTNASDILRDMKLNYGLDIPYHKAWYGKERARESVLGVEADSYRQLRWFAEKTTQANPGSRVDVQCIPLSESPQGDVRFLRMYVSYFACVSGFQHCRPVLHIDATFITNKYRGMLLAACAKDANGGLYPVAYAIVDSETEDNWTYFFGNLQESLSKFPPRTITFISDRNIGLLNAVQKVFPESPLGFCYRHLQANLLNKFPSASVHGKRISYLFMVCAYSRTQECFDANLAKLKHEGGHVIEAFLKDLPVKTWASSQFNGERFGEMSNNLAECFNSWVKELKGLPITELNEQIRIKVMDLIASRKHKAVGWNSELTPCMEKTLAENMALGGHWEVSRSNTFVYEVHSEKKVMVNLERSACSCGEWQINGFPCAHALVAAQKHGADVYSYVNPIFKVDKYHSTYSFTINPVPTISKSVEMVSRNVNIHPPQTKRPAGRPKKTRFKPRSDVKRIIKCSRCNKAGGHNRKTCKAVIST